MADERSSEPWSASVAAALGFVMGFWYVSGIFPDDFVTAVLVGLFFGLSWGAIAAAVDFRLGELLSYLFYGAVWLHRRRGAGSQQPREGP